MKKLTGVPNARFWVFHRGGWVKLTLRPEQELSVANYSRHNDDWSLEVDIWRHDGDRVTNKWSTDCDWRHSSTGERECLLSELRSGVHDGTDITMPLWQLTGSSYRDKPRKRQDERGA